VTSFFAAIKTSALLVYLLFQIKWMWRSQRRMHANVRAILVPGDSIRTCHSYRTRLCAGWEWLCLQTKICSHWWIRTKCYLCNTPNIAQWFTELTQSNYGNELLFPSWFQRGSYRGPGAIKF